MCKPVACSTTIKLREVILAVARLEWEPCCAREIIQINYKINQIVIEKSIGVEVKACGANANYTNL